MKHLHIDVITHTSITVTANKTVKIFITSILVLVDENFTKPHKPINKGLGIDLGLKNFSICSNNIKFKNINNSKKVKQIEKN